MEIINAVHMEFKEDTVDMLLGKQKACMEVYDDGTFGFYYGKEMVFRNEGAFNISEIREAIWEWLCSLSRLTTPDNSRTLGSWFAVRDA